MRLEHIYIPAVGIYDCKGRIVLSIVGPKGVILATALITRAAATALIAALQNAVENSEGE